MEAERKIIFHNHATLRTATRGAAQGSFLDHLSDNWSGAVERLRQTGSETWERTPEWIKKTTGFLLHPISLLLIGLILITTFAVLFNYYLALSKEIDTRLRNEQFIDGSMGLYASPIQVKRGDRFELEEISSHLLAAGYQPAAASTGSASDRSFLIEGNSINIWPESEAAEPGTLPIKLVLDGKGRIKSIHDLRTRVELETASIEGGLLASVRGGDRRKKTVVSFSDIPLNLKNALLAVEDRRFFSHNGIDWRGILRALYKDVNEGEIVQGGSTLTQQLVKNSFLTADRTFSRKLKEAAMAIILESRLSKEEIFTHYCNDVYLGQAGGFAIHGFAEASQSYFNKPISDLTLSESAYLAGLVHAPNRYSLGQDTQLAVERRNLVLNAMVETEAITREEAEAAKLEELKLQKKKSTDQYGESYFVDYAQRFTEERGFSSRQRLYTTMDPRLQRAAYEAVRKHTARLDKLYARSVRKGEGRPKVQAALVALDAHTGEVLAMVGGRDYEESQLNRATDAMRQPGSTFKPFVYAAAFSTRRVTPSTLLSDRPQVFKYGRNRTYEPSNFHGGYSNRDVTAREALVRSLNVPAVELALKTGLGSIASLAEDAGLGNPHAYPSLALGTSEVTPLQLAGAYTAFANFGMALRPIPIRKTVSPDQTMGETPVRAMAVRVFSPQIAHLMTTLMESVVDSGTAASLRRMGLRGAIAGKTGTSNDGWFAGYTPNLVCVAWVGFDDNKDMRVQAADSALPMWADFVREALEIRPELGGDGFVQPAGLSKVVVDPTTGLIAGPDCT
ncbi:MAG TPA: PBP1A family penicillin-binding protein, partial [Blastocatellia bacterium]|nr:PBP1A family penicillin-binding protein [Blastocatellia bacterium]